MPEKRATGDRFRSIALSASLLAALLSHGAAGADASRGAVLYESRCVACHSLDANRVGPRHRGVYNRVAGSVPGYAYSPALAESQIRWSTETLDRWLTDPQALIPGQRMGFRVSSAEDRADIIDYLKRESSAR